MIKQRIHSILHDVMGDQIPASSVDLWGAVKTSLAAGQTQQGEIMNATQPRRIVRAAFALLVIGALLTLALITPQGKAFAQSILQFFVRADQDRYPLQDWQMTPPVQTSLDSPFKLSVQEAEALAGYDVLSPVEIPPGMVFVGASYDEKYHIVAQAFGQSADQLGFSLWQQPLEYYQPCGDISHLCDNILGSNLAGSSADIQTVQIGDLTGEYVEGVWSLTDKGPIWDPTPFAKTLRWKTDKAIFELVHTGMDLTRDDLVTLAASIR